MALFEYAITRPIRLGWLGICLFWTCGICYLVIITLLNVIAVGYDTVVVTAAGQPSSGHLWYENVAFASWLPPAMVCNPAQLTQNESTSFTTPFG
jgi:hypothetical protein